ncbi:hypothetical protein EAG_15826 [Camponotus floridanus]|uniref:Ig-like domain-containing protein n=1 Tax=Camponotus floridanus TaxID=104421 RepID=E2AUH4_CAMFO|nr:hypothetical protein EAG_15826 [Camponotus floridanus]
MCQVNTNPMISQVGYLQVVVPPNILDSLSTESTVAVREHQNITLTCKADGYPLPKLMWKREDGQVISLNKHNKENFLRLCRKFENDSNEFSLTMSLVCANRNLEALLQGETNVFVMQPKFNAESNFWYEDVLLLRFSESQTESHESWHRRLTRVVTDRPTFARRNSK